MIKRARDDRPPITIPQSDPKLFTLIKLDVN